MISIKNSENKASRKPRAPTVRTSRSGTGAVRVPVAAQVLHHHDGLVQPQNSETFVNSGPIPDTAPKEKCLTPPYNHLGCSFDGIPETRSISMINV